MMRMLPLNALLFGRYENAADDEKKKTKKKIHHDDTNNIPKTPLLLLSSSFCQRKRKPEQQRRLLKRASRENEKRKVVCREVVFLCVFANLIDFFLLSFFCSSILKLERKSTPSSSIDTKGFETEKGVSRLPARSVRPHSRRLRLLAAESDHF